MTLEDLPAELRQQLLSLLELDDLRTLVKASPVYHQHYMADRGTILLRSLEQTLQSVIFTAGAAHLTSLDAFRQIRCGDICKIYIDSYQYLVNEDPYSLPKCPVSIFGLEDYITMASFYLSTILPLVKYYTNWTLTNLDKLCQRGPSHQVLSKCEHTRLLRGFYRYQFFSNLYGTASDDAYYSKCLDSCAVEIDSRFGNRAINFKAMAQQIRPWELEEVYAVYYFATSVLRRAFCEVDWSMRDPDGTMNSKVDDPREAIKMAHSNNYSRSTLSVDDTTKLPPKRTGEEAMIIPSVAARGLHLLSAVLFEISNYSDLLTTLNSSFPVCIFNWVDSFPGPDYPQTGNMTLYPITLPVPFRGDFETSLAGQHPPLAWTLIWNDTENVFFGDRFEYPWERNKCLSDEHTYDDHRRNGLIFWDAVRIRNTIVEEYLAGFWSYYGRQDPRSLTRRSILGWNQAVTTPAEQKKPTWPSMDNARGRLDSSN